MLLPTARCRACHCGGSPNTVAEILKKVSNPVLICGSETLILSSTNRHNLIKTQAKLLKSSLGLPKTNRMSTGKQKPLNWRMIIHCLSRNTIIHISSRARLSPVEISSGTCGRRHGKSKNEVIRSTQLCQDRNIDFIKYLINDGIKKEKQKDYERTRFCKPGNDGQVDSFY